MKNPIFKFKNLKHDLNNKVVLDIKDIKINDIIDIELYKGKFNSIVQDKTGG